MKRSTTIPLKSGGIHKKKSTDCLSTLWFILAKPRPEQHSHPRLLKKKKKVGSPVQRGGDPLAGREDDFNCINQIILRCYDHIWIWNLLGSPEGCCVFQDTPCRWKVLSPSRSLVRSTKSRAVCFSLRLIPVFQKKTSSSDRIRLSFSPPPPPPPPPPPFHSYSTAAPGHLLWWVSSRKRKREALPTGHVC